MDKAKEEKVATATATATVDKQFVAECFGRAIGTYDKNAVVQKGVAAALAALMRRADFPAGANIYEVGAGTGLMTSLLVAEFAPCHIVANDLCAECAEPVAKASGGRAVFLCGDADALPIPEGTDAVVSCSAVQWLEDKPAFFRKVAAALADGGFFAFSTFGADNLREMCELGVGGLAYDSAEAYERMLAEAGFRIVAATDGTESVFFPDTRTLLRHFRETGVGGIRREKWTLRETMRFCHEYERRFRDPRGLALTYHPLAFVCTRCTNKPDG